MTFTAQQIRLPDQGVRASALTGTALSSLRDEAPDGSSPFGLQSTDATCTFAEMLPLFAELFEPNIAHCMSLIGRMKFLIKNGACGGIKGQRGKTVAYSCDQVRELLTMMEMTHIGLPPQKAVELYREYRDVFFGQTGCVTIAVGPRDSSITIDTGPIREAARRHLPQLFTGRREE